MHMKRYTLIGSSSSSCSSSFSSATVSLSHTLFSRFLFESVPIPLLHFMLSFAFPHVPALVPILPILFFTCFHERLWRIGHSISKSKLIARPVLQRNPPQLAAENELAVMLFYVFVFLFWLFFHIFYTLLYNPFTHTHTHTHTHKKNVKASIWSVRPTTGGCPWGLRGHTGLGPHKPFGHKGFFVQYVSLDILYTVQT